ncbi:MAG TPA: TraR/DksA C4-type zinc finger protein [Dehalococcoidales bacterium]|nr:TraR/DksA C4-type zinc finger protein [Dehalococcoidales bacterium]
MALDVAKIKTRLESEKLRLLDEIEQLQAAGRPSDERRDGSPFGKREEEATESQELERRLALERSIKEQLAALENALGKINGGTYGKCESCGKPIEPARLEAIPQARRCLRCKTLESKNAKIR